MISKYIASIFEGEAPCDKCDQFNLCKEEEMACRAFSYYVLHGSFSVDTPRHPTNGLYNQIFSDDDRALKSYMKSLAAKEGGYGK